MFTPWIRRFTLNRPVESLTVSELSRHIKTALALREQTAGRGDDLEEVLGELIDTLQYDRDRLEDIIAERERPKY